MRRHELHFSPTLTASSRGDIHNISYVFVLILATSSTALLNLTYHLQGYRCIA
jgi:hypothetical protein